MHNGYFLTLFAPDSGQGPGGFLLYDVSNPRAMQLVKRIYEPEGRTAEFREAHAIGTSTIGGCTAVGRNSAAGGGAGHRLTASYRGGGTAAVTPPILITVTAARATAASPSGESAVQPGGM